MEKAKIRQELRRARRMRRALLDAEPYLADYPQDDITTIIIHRRLANLNWTIAHLEKKQTQLK